MEQLDKVQCVLCAVKRLADSMIQGMTSHKQPDLCWLVCQSTKQ